LIQSLQDLFTLGRTFTMHSALEQTHLTIVSLPLLNY